MKKETEYLSLVKNGRYFLPSTTGRETRHSARTTFSYDSLEERFSNLNIFDRPTPAENFLIYDLIQDGFFENIFKSLGKNPHKFALTRSQILVICQNRKLYPDLIQSDGYCTYFLGEFKDELFVAELNSSLNVVEHDFNSRRFWYWWYFRKFVVRG